MFRKAQFLTVFLGLLAVPTSALANTLTFQFNCHLAFPQTNPGSCATVLPGAPYGTMTLTDVQLAGGITRIDISLTAIAQPGYGNTLERFYLNFQSPFLTNHQFYMVPVGTPANGGPDSTPYQGLTIGSTAYTNNNTNFLGFFFDFSFVPTSGNMTFTGSLALFDQITDMPVNINTSMFNLQTSGTGSPALWAGYRTHNTASGPEFHAGATTQVTAVPEPTSLLLVGTGVMFAARQLRRRGK
jgi:hypothetical protein